MCIGPDDVKAMIDMRNGQVMQRRMCQGQGSEIIRLRDLNNLHEPFFSITRSYLLTHLTDNLSEHVGRKIQ